MCRNIINIYIFLKYFASSFSPSLVDRADCYSLRVYGIPLTVLGISVLLYTIIALAAVSDFRSRCLSVLHCTC